MTDTDIEYGNRIGSGLKDASASFQPPIGMFPRVADRERQRDRRRASVRVGALGVAAVVTVGGLAWVKLGRGADVAPASQAGQRASGPTYLVPSQLPAGFVVYSGTRHGPIVSDSGAPYVPWAEQVYAPLDFTSPQQLVGVVHSAMCTGASTVDINESRAAVCEPFYGAQAISWAHGDQAITVTAGPLISIPQLVAFADSLDLHSSNDNQPPVPDGWNLLSDNTTLIDPSMSQVLYTAGPTSADGGLKYIEVRLWTGTPPRALYAVGASLCGTPITIHGVPAIIDDKEPNNVFIYWADPSGSVVSVQAYNGTREEAITVAEGLQTTDQAGLDTLVASGSPAPFALPRDATPDETGVEVTGGPGG